MKKMVSLALSAVLLLSCAFSAGAASSENESNALENLKEGTRIIHHVGYTEKVTVKNYKDQKDIDRVLAEARNDKKGIKIEHNQIQPAGIWEREVDLVGNKCTSDYWRCNRTVIGGYPMGGAPFFFFSDRALFKIIHLK
ncbi:hypothetical protein [Paenibacillus oleatilyticus]|uniref:hypothetical protein n=1 Tax=Paenibacillus oleatilyticus TaxID=2594886 RepID=UPI001C1FE8F8|nr:hypothetical protein [Paenibacillus oleatilyticus]MBU7318882.1 hypothetical protein [Paenibacillus oleatilyticus]